MDFSNIICVVDGRFFQIVSGKFGAVEVIRSKEAKPEIMRDPGRVVSMRKSGRGWIRDLLYKMSSISG